MTPHEIITATLAQVPDASFPELAQVIINTLETNGFVVVAKQEEKVDDAA